MPNSYTITFTPATWNAFRNSKTATIGFRSTLSSHVNQLKRDDLLICYLAERMKWCAALRVLGRSKNTKNNLFSTEFNLPLIVDVEPIFALAPEQEISVKNQKLWDQLDRFKHHDHTVSGWAVNVGIHRSLRLLSENDSKLLLDALEVASNQV